MFSSIYPPLHFVSPAPNYAGFKGVTSRRLCCVTRRMPSSLGGCWSASILLTVIFASSLRRVRTQVSLPSIKLGGVSTPLTCLEFHFLLYQFQKIRTNSLPHQTRHRLDYWTLPTWGWSTTRDSWLSPGQPTISVSATRKMMTSRTPPRKIKSNYSAIKRITSRNWTDISKPSSKIPKVNS